MASGFWGKKMFKFTREYLRPLPPADSVSVKMKSLGFSLCTGNPIPRAIFTTKQCVIWTEFLENAPKVYEQLDNKQGWHVDNPDKAPKSSQKATELKMAASIPAEPFALVTEPYRGRTAVVIRSSNTFYYHVDFFLFYSLSNLVGATGYSTFSDGEDTVLKFETDGMVSAVCNCEKNTYMFNDNCETYFSIKKHVGTLKHLDGDSVSFLKLFKRHKQNCPMFVKSNTLHAGSLFDFCVEFAVSGIQDGNYLLKNGQLAYISGLADMVESSPAKDVCFAGPENMVKISINNSDLKTLLLSKSDYYFLNVFDDKLNRPIKVPHDFLEILLKTNRGKFLELGISFDNDTSSHYTIIENSRLWHVWGDNI